MICFRKSLSAQSSKAPSAKSVPPPAPPVIRDKSLPIYDKPPPKYDKPPPGVPPPGLPPGAPPHVYDKPPPSTMRDSAPAHRDKREQAPPGGKAGGPWMQGFEPQQPSLPWPANRNEPHGGDGGGTYERSSSYHSDRGHHGSRSRDLDRDHYRDHRDDRRDDRR